MTARRSVLAGGLALPGALSLAACASGVGTTDTADGLTVLTYDDVDSAELLREQLAGFTADSGTATTLDTVPGSGAAQFPDKLRTRILGGNAPDVWRIWGGQIGQPFVDAGLTVDLAPYYEQYGWEEALAPAGIEGMTFHGERHGAPLNVASLGAWCNAALFEQAGAAVPTTYGELEAANEAILASGVTPAGFGGKYGWHIMRLFEYLLETTAGPELHDALLVGEESWENQAVVEAFELFRTWNDRGWITPGALGVAPADAEQSFVQGTTAYTISGPWIEGQYILPSGKPVTDFDTFLLPTDHDVVRHSGFVEGFMISATSGAPDEAAALLAHLLTPAVQKALGNSQSAVLASPPDPEQFPLSAAWTSIRETSPIYTIQDQAFPKAVADSYFAVQSSVLQGKDDPRTAAADMQTIVSEWRNQA
ncbi:ABC transporter substrate-binding protein [Brachybacterium sp. NBEC-018]|uniref:ABC transporter substrate-binding protein n=1 Tax=Brachybacterium sp. NBEC-018 TaxID=2996004 RepID=UPI00217567A1|nr:ABC transporter substrate-binding protein [Brachybacterium sp. NBEC-018]UVY84518.1 ABC transporter substrate-binding protein [Brachybacterium sp. NBEC-018]